MNRGLASQSCDHVICFGNRQPNIFGKIKETHRTRHQQNILLLAEFYDKAQPLNILEQEDY